MDPRNQIVVRARIRTPEPSQNGCAYDANADTNGSVETPHRPHRPTVCTCSVV